MRIDLDQPAFEPPHADQSVGKVLNGAQVVGVTPARCFTDTSGQQ